jgi:hypothetical protein
MRHVRDLLAVVFALLVVVAGANSAAAQSQATTGEINGTAVDTQGAVLPGVSVTATNPETGYNRVVTSNDVGAFVLPLMPPGAYELRAELQGFAPFSRTLRLTVGATVTVNPTMNIGGVAEAIVVVAGVPTVETSATVRTTTLSQEAINSLPINGRRFQDFITLTPTVQVDTSRGQLSFAGQRGINSNVSIDGADYNQPFFGGIRGGERSNNAFTIPQEAIQEFQVVASGYSAEFGRSTGGIVNAITKSGTNTNHGSVFYLNRNKDWAEKNAFGQNAAPTQQQFGGSFGGPIARNRLFFFGAYELQRLKNTRNVVFLLTGITPDATTQEGYNFYRNLEEPFDTTNDADALLGRVDYQMMNGRRLSLRYSFSNNEALNANATGNALSDTTISALSNNGTERDRTNTVVGEFTSVTRTGLLLEMRGQYSREQRPRDANTQMPLLNIGTIGNVGTVSFLGENIQRDWRGQAAANATWVKRSHSVKFGTEYNHVDASQKFGFDQFGTYSVTGAAASALEIISVGGPNANRFDVPRTVAVARLQVGNLQTALATNELAFYAQDAWKVTPNFTLNYGLRWEGAFNPTPEANNDFILSQLRNVTFPFGKQVDPTQIPDQLGQFGPRLGFAWDPSGTGRTVMRGYTGLYYARSPMLLFSDPMSGFRQPPGNVTVTLPFQVPATNPNQTLYQQLLLAGINLNNIPLGQLPRLTQANLTAIATGLGITPNPYLGVGVIAVDTEFKNPRATQAGAGIEHEVAPNLSVAADFTYVKTDNLQRNRDLNIGIPTPRATDPAQRPIFPARPLSTLASVQIRESSARSEYTALTMSTRLRRRWSELSANYVLSKSMSDDDNERDSGGVQYENAFNLDSEWGPARLDRRHQFNGYAAFFLPHGLDLSATFKALSGLPIDATIGRDINSSLGGSDRPYSAAGQPFQRNGFRDLPFRELNFRAQWGPKLSAGRPRAVVTFDVFNVFNAENIRLSGNTVTNYCAGTAPDDCGFGAPTNANFLQVKDAAGNYITTNIPGAPRQVQLGVRFEF